MTQKKEEGVSTPWRIQEKTADGNTVEYSGSGLFDELVIEGVLHLEWLDDKSWYIRVGDAKITATVLTDERVQVDVLRGAYGEVCGETNTWEP